MWREHGVPATVPRRLQCAGLESVSSRSRGYVWWKASDHARARCQGQLKTAHRPGGGATGCDFWQLKLHIFGDVIRAALTASAGNAGSSTATGYRIEQDPQAVRQQETARPTPADMLAGIFDEEIVPMLEESLRAYTRSTVPHDV